MKTKIDLQNDPMLSDVVATRSATVFEERYPNLLACFDVSSVFSAIAAVFRIEGGPAGADFTVPIVVAATEDAFRKLLTRGALNQFQVVPAPLPPAAQIELDKLFGIEEEDEQVVAQATKVSERQALVEQAKRDWRTLDSRECRRIWANTPERLAILESAWSELEVQDRNIASGYKVEREKREREANAALNNAPLSPRNF